MVYYDVIIKEVSRNQSPFCYLNIHDKFVEIYLFCHSGTTRKTKEYLEHSGLFELKQWNKKHPKILKLLKAYNTIEDYSFDHRISCFGEPDEQENLEVFLKNNTHFFKVLEQVRREGYIWDKQRFPQLSWLVFRQSLKQI